MFEMLVLLSDDFLYSFGGLEIEVGYLWFDNFEIFVRHNFDILKKLKNKKFEVKFEKTSIPPSCRLTL